jgi:hypothetical protein
MFWLDTAQDMGFHDLPPGELDLMADAVIDAIAKAKRAMRGALDPTVILECIDSIAKRKGLDMPAGPMFEVEVEVMASWPPDLWLKAFSGVVKTHVYPRVPTCGEFFAFIQGDLAERQSKVDRLVSLENKIRIRERDAAAKREAEWMERGRVRPTQAELDAVAAIKQQVHRHLTTPPAASAAAGQSAPADPRSDHASPDQPPPTAQSGTP